MFILIALIALVRSSSRFKRANQVDGDQLEGVKGIRIESLDQFNAALEDNTTDLAQNKHYLIEFYSDDCHFCHKFMPEWNQLVEQFRDQPIKFLLINGQTQYELVRRYKPEGFPTFLYLKPKSNGKIAKTYGLDLKLESLKRWLQHQVDRYKGTVEDPTRNLTKESVEMMDMDDINIVLNQFHSKLRGHLSNKEQLDALSSFILEKEIRDDQLKELISRQRISYQSNISNYSLMFDCLLFAIGVATGLMSALLFSIYSIKSSSSSRKDYAKTQ